MIFINVYDIINKKDGKTELDMVDIEKIYNQLTNIDIEEQRKLWNERGKGYYGEYLVFCKLYKQVSGNCKILMNLNIPTINSKTTEIDLLLIHETGIYIFEVKHYKGTIYGKDSDNIWTQYFRTVKNNTFRNPMLQNDYHVKAIKNIFHDIPIKSIVVFTNSECDIRVTNLNPDVMLCLLCNVNETLENCFNRYGKIFSMEQIDSIFNELSQYSQMREIVLYDGEEKSFLAWVPPVISEFEQEKNKLIEEYNKLKKIKTKGIITNIAVAIICIIVSIITAAGIQRGYNIALQKNDAELAMFKQNFLHVDEIGNEYISDLNSYAAVSDVSITELSDTAVSFTARITALSDVYGIALTKNSKYIVITDSKKVFEYDVFGKHLSYNRLAFRLLGKSVFFSTAKNLEKAQFHGVNKGEISYIKITNIELFKSDISWTVVKDGLEIELYSK